jgi:hypothetical protein
LPTRHSSPDLPSVLFSRGHEAGVLLVPGDHRPGIGVRVDPGEGEGRDLVDETVVLRPARRDDLLVDLVAGSAKEYRPPRRVPAGARRGNRAGSTPFHCPPEVLPVLGVPCRGAIAPLVRDTVREACRLGHPKVGARPPDLVEGVPSRSTNRSRKASLARTVFRTAVSKSSWSISPRNR